MLVEHRKHYDCIFPVEKVHAVGKSPEQRTTQRPADLWELPRHRAGAFYDAIELGQEASTEPSFLDLIPFPD
jgi:hypothetical protein